MNWSPLTHTMKCSINARAGQQNMSYTFDTQFRTTTTVFQQTHIWYTQTNTRKILAQGKIDSIENAISERNIPRAFTKKITRADSKSVQYITHMLKPTITLFNMIHFRCNIHLSVVNRSVVKCGATNKSGRFVPESFRLKAIFQKPTKST